jgi:hypothetical protein
MNDRKMGTERFRTRPPNPYLSVPRFLSDLFATLLFACFQHCTAPLQHGSSIPSNRSTIRRFAAKVRAFLK